MKRTSLAISHLPLLCCGVDLPLQSADKAVQYFAADGSILIGSYGVVHWNIQLSLAEKYGVPTELIIPEECSVSLQIIKEQFPDLIVVSITETESPQERDRLIFEAADRIFRVWCRSGGALEKILGSFKSKTVTDFDVSSFRFKSLLKQSVNRPSAEIRAIPADYLWHWTRTCSQWPGETAGAFCSDLLSSQRYPRSALNTLQRIAETELLIGSSSMIGDGEPVVCFTENHPAEMTEHFAWRTGRHRMNFEPYAIGFPRHYLISAGAEPVRYGGISSWNSFGKSVRWQSEREWRIRGDLQFHEADQPILIVRSESERCGIFSGASVYESKW